MKEKPMSVALLATLLISVPLTASFQPPFAARPPPVHSFHSPVSTTRALPGRRLPLHPTSVRHAREKSKELSNTDGDDGSSTLEERGLRSYVTGLAWLGFVGYAFLCAPGMDEAAKVLDAQLLKDIIADPFSPAVPSIFVAIFNALGLMPFVYTSLLLPGSRDQIPPAWPFTLASFALGFFALGPYLALRRYRPFPDTAYASPWLTRVMESKVPALLAFLASLYLVWLTVDGVVSTGGREAYLSLFYSQTLPHVSSLDLGLLSLFVVDPLREDMVRRQWYSPGRLLAFVALPVVGPCLYLLLRPTLKGEAGAEG